MYLRRQPNYHNIINFIRMKKLLGFIFSLVLLSSCAQEDQVITIANQYSLTVPGYMSEMPDLHDDASLQYGNLFKEAYVIVLDEPKGELKLALEENNLLDYYSNDLDGYADLIFESMEEEINNGYLLELQDTVVNNTKAKITSLMGEYDGINIVYYLGVYEGKERYYQVITWTQQSKAEKTGKALQALLYTLKEMN